MAKTGELFSCDVWMANIMQIKQWCHLNTHTNVNTINMTRTKTSHN